MNQTLALTMPIQKRKTREKADPVKEKTTHYRDNLSISKEVGARDRANLLIREAK